ncbi:MAG: hypothetical protein GF329_16955 [Candidatus Lokiarchaeota archaeon]|nr:hypothetical protein [Candidatus Lokiarchaeota archaeon]
MDIVDLTILIKDLNIALNFVISVFVLQIGLMFILQWYKLGRQDLDNKVALSYGIYYTLFAISIFLYFYIIGIGVDPYLFDLLFVISTFMRLIGGIILSVMLDITLKDIWNLKYVFSILFISMFLIFSILTITHFIFNHFLMYKVIELFNLMFSLIPIIFTYYFMKKSLKIIRRKLKVAIIGLILLPMGLAFTSIRARMFFEKLDFTYLIMVSISRFIIIISLMLIMIGFTEYSFSSESSWKENLVSIYIFDQSNRILFHKNFLKFQIKREDVLSKGIRGIKSTLENFDIGNDIQILNFGNNTILLEKGGRIFTAMIIKKKFLNDQYLLREITSKFEYYFWSYLEGFDLSDRSLDIESFFQPMDSVINNILSHGGI